MISIIVVSIIVFLFIAVFSSLDTPQKENDKELFHKYGELHLTSLRRENEELKCKLNKTEKYYENIQNKINTCVLIFEEYFAQDQTNDDLLVMAFEQLHSISDLKIEGFCTDEDYRRILRKGLTVVKLEMQKLKDKV